MNPILPERVAAFAEAMIGRRESGKPNTGPDIQQFFEADSYKPNAADNGYPWCAAFVCWCVMRAMEGRVWTFQRPTTPRAWAFENWSLAQDRSTWTLKPAGRDIRRGDIVIFTFSHIGIAVGSPDKHGWVRTVEGNTNQAGSREGDGVYLKVRNVSSIRSRIRFRV
jgi:hypothetical protein